MNKYFSEKYGNTVDEAVDLALKDLKSTRDDVEIEILEEPSRGFFGIGSKLAKIRVTLKNMPQEEEEIEVPMLSKQEKESQEEKKEEKVSEKTIEKAKESSSTTNDVSGRSNEKSGKNRNRGGRGKNRGGNRNKEKEKEVFEPKIITTRPDDLQEVEESKALDFLRAISEKMDLNLSFTAKENADSLYVDIEGKDAGTIIGKRGQTLDSVQYLTSLVVNKDKEDYVRVVLDAENYRAKREKTLSQLAQRLARKVCKTGRSVRLEPMNPYERMVIHATLQNDEKVVTRSEGDEPFRRVIIDLK